MTGGARSGVSMTAIEVAPPRDRPLDRSRRRHRATASCDGIVRRHRATASRDGIATTAVAGVDIA
jgi:hypothetical protein